MVHTRRQEKQVALVKSQERPSLATSKPKHIKVFYYGVPFRSRDGTTKGWFGPYQTYALDASTYKKPKKTKGETSSSVETPCLTTLTGLILEEPQESSICSTGFHCSDTLEGALLHYNPYHYEKVHDGFSPMTKSTLDSIRAYEVTMEGDLTSVIENAPFEHYRKFSTNRMLIGREIPLKEPEHFNPYIRETTKTDAHGVQTRRVKHYHYKYNHRDLQVGPATLVYNQKELVEYEFAVYGSVLRLNGPCSMYCTYTTFSSECMFMSGILQNIETPKDIDMAASAAPDHEWDEKTCGAGNCWQWNHNPQRYGLGHTQPPKEMFTWVLRPGYEWDYTYLKTNKWVVKHGNRSPSTSIYWEFDSTRRPDFLDTYFQTHT